jgi:hypothetical protein
VEKDLKSLKTAGSSHKKQARFKPFSRKWGVFAVSPRADKRLRRTGRNKTVDSKGDGWEKRVDMDCDM